MERKRYQDGPRTNMQDIMDRFYQRPNPFREGMNNDATTLAVGEEGGGGRNYSTQAVGEEGGGGMPPPFLRGDKPVRGPRPPMIQTRMVGENGGGDDVFGPDRPGPGGRIRKPRPPKRGPFPIRGEGKPVPDDIRDRNPNIIGIVEAPKGPYGGRIGSKPGTMHTADFKDGDGDGVDDRNQRRPGGKDIVKRRREKSLERRKAEKSAKRAENGNIRERARTQRTRRQAEKAEQLKERYKGGIKKAMKRRKREKKQQYS